MTWTAPNINRVWADLIIEELTRLGVTRFVVAPGSRSTPLATAIAANPRAEAVIHYDERSTAYYAVGYARATGRPAAWVTTSGTAVANGFPAVVEASQDGLPLLLLTADRPPELRSSGSNQTIDQQKIFGGYVRWYFDLPAPAVDVDPRFVLTTVDQAVHRAVSAPAGPVQLNCMFREPLAPVEDGYDLRGHAAITGEWERSGRPYTEYRASDRRPSSEAAGDLAKALAYVERGVVVAGRLPASADSAPVEALAQTLNWPLLSDVNSQLRFGSRDAVEVVPYHAMLHAAAFRDAVRPQAVLYFGAPAVSNRLAQYLRTSTPDHFVLVQDGPFRFDPDHIVTTRFDCDVSSFCELLREQLPVASPRWAGRWRSAARAALARMAEEFARTDDLSEPWVASRLPALLPAGSRLFLGSSMPVRDVDAFSFEGVALRVGANRGASGIDGTVSTAVGFGAGSELPTALLLGDLALLHDLNALAFLRGVRQPFPLVVINNDGGGIFSFLPIAQFEDVFERFFGTPHGLRFEQAAAMFGLPYAHCESRREFEEAVRRALARQGGSIIEVTTDRTENVRLHRAFDERVTEAVVEAIQA